MTSNPEHKIEDLAPDQDAVDQVRGGGGGEGINPNPPSGGGGGSNGVGGGGGSGSPGITDKQRVNDSNRS
jgi:hypothetical protein